MRVHQRIRSALGPLVLLVENQRFAGVRQPPSGTARSYGDLAAELGNQAKGRAIGAAVRLNPLSIVNPGNRVMSCRGKVTGYSAGTEMKAKLIALERGHAGNRAAPRIPLR
jgi:methylated-DNA-[protein]-cysteine S-methyltransferase